MVVLTKPAIWEGDSELDYHSMRFIQFFDIF